MGWLQTKECGMLRAVMQCNNEIIRKKYQLINEKKKLQTLKQTVPLH